MDNGAGCFLEVVDNRRLVWTAALGPGFRPTDSDFPFTAIITMEPSGSGTKYRAVAVHGSKDLRDQHDEMGFHEGWGAALDQLVRARQGLLSRWRRQRATRSRPRDQASPAVENRIGCGPACPAEHRFGFGRRVPIPAPEPGEDAAQLSTRGGEFADHVVGDLISRHLRRGVTQALAQVARDVGHPHEVARAEEALACGRGSRSWHGCEGRRCRARRPLRDRSAAVRASRRATSAISCVEPMLFAREDRAEHRAREHRRERRRCGRRVHEGPGRRVRERLLARRYTGMVVSSASVHNVSSVTPSSAYDAGLAALAADVITTRCTPAAAAARATPGVCRRGRER